MKKMLISLVLVAFAVSAFAKTKPVTATFPTIFIEAGQGFDVTIAAAITKKHTPVNITTDRTKATLILHANDVEQKINTDKTGTKVAKIIFGVPTILPANVSVQLVDQDGKIMWAYSCTKGWDPHHNGQSLAEAIAKHLKSYLEKDAKQ